MSGAMRNTKTYGSYTTNPFEETKTRHSANIYQPDAYTLNLLISLSPKALRILLVMASRVDPATGISYCPTRDLKSVFGWCQSNISAAKMELIRAGLVAYGRANHSFYLNPKAFTPIHITI
jgi:hypothetical protein